jgi:hypothetical protein
MAVAGTPTQLIGAAVNRSPQTIAKLLKEDEDIAQRRELYQGQVLRVFATQHYEMLSMVDTALGVIRETLTGQDARLKSENAWKVMDRCFPQAKQVDLNVGGSMSVEARHELDGHMASISASMTEIRERAEGVLGSKWRQRVRTGPDALPGPVSQIPAGSLSESDKPSINKGNGSPPGDPPSDD